MNTSICKDIAELSPLAQQACLLFLKECKKQNIPVFITETYRSQERQDYLYSLGRTRPGQIVTWTKNSRHTSRRAWDIAISAPYDTYDVAQLAKAGHIAMSLGMTWGGTWDTPDRPHVEIKTNWVAPKEEEEEMTQEDFNKFLTNYLKQIFSEPVNQIFKEDWEYVIANKLLDGSNPKGFVTREQLSAVLHRIGAKRK